MKIYLACKSCLHIIYGVDTVSLKKCCYTTPQPPRSVKCAYRTARKLNSFWPIRSAAYAMLGSQTMGQEGESLLS